MMLTLSSMPTAILREDIPLISGVQDAETSAIFSKRDSSHPARQLSFFSTWDECACDLDWLMFSSIAIVIDNYDRMFRLTKHPSDEKRHFEECLSRMHEYWTEEAKVPCEITIFSEQGKYDN